MQRHHSQKHKEQIELNTDHNDAANDFILIRQNASRLSRTSSVRSTGPINNFVGSTENNSIDEHNLR